MAPRTKELRTSAASLLLSFAGRIVVTVVLSCGSSGVLKAREREGGASARNKRFLFLERKSSKAAYSRLNIPGVSSISQLVSFLFLWVRALRELALLGELFLFRGGRGQRAMKFAAIWQSSRKVKKIAGHPAQAHSGLGACQQDWPSSC